MNCIIAGASGLVGKSLLQLLLQDNNFSTITVLSRTLLADVHPKLQNQIISFDQLQNTLLPEADIAFCCLGTTIKTAGSQDAFYKVDHDYIVEFGKACAKVGVKFCIWSCL